MSKEGKKGDFYPDKATLAANLQASPHKEAIQTFLEEHQVPLDKLLNWPRRRSQLLSDIAILRHFLAGNIVIDPFNIDQLTPNSYDVKLGKYFYRRKTVEPYHVSYRSPRHHPNLIRCAFPLPEEKRYEIYNPADPHNVVYSWEPDTAYPASAFMKINGVTLEGIKPEEKIIMIHPGEQLLGHTDEFIGGRNVITCIISACSTTGRNLLEVCNDAFQGHVGFATRWTLEIKNKSGEEQPVAIPLVIGRKLAQIAFYEVEPAAQSYKGQYQGGSSLEEIKKSWRPQLMLPGKAKDLTSTFTEARLGNCILESRI